MWNSRGVASSSAMTRRSEPSGFRLLKYWKLARLSRTRMGTLSAELAMFAAAALVSRVISLRYGQSPFHQALPCPHAAPTRQKLRTISAKTRLATAFPAFSNWHDRAGDYVQLT